MSRTQSLDAIIEEIYNNTNNELDENQALLESIQSRLEQMSLEINRLKDLRHQKDTLPTDTQNLQPYPVE